MAPFSASSCVVPTPMRILMHLYSHTNTATILIQSPPSCKQLTGCMASNFTSTPIQENTHTSAHRQTPAYMYYIQACTSGVCVGAARHPLAMHICTAHTTHTHACLCTHTHTYIPTRPVWGLGACPQAQVL